MDSFRKIINFIINEYIFLGLIVASFITFTYNSIAVSPNLYYILVAAISTIIIYKYISPLKSVKQFFFENKLFFGITILLLLSLCFLILTVKSLIALGLAGFLTLCYFFGWPPFFKPLRTYMILKPCLIGIVYSILVCQIPMIEAHYLAHEYMFSMAAIFLFVSALAIVFDLGDVEEDQRMNTCPKILGIVPSKIIVTLLMILATSAMYYSAWTYMISIPESVSFSISCFIGVIVGWKAMPSNPKSFYLMKVDGVMALPYMINIVINFI